MGETTQTAEQSEPRPLKSLVRDTLIYGSGFATMAAVSLILTPIYTHHLSPSEFGLLALMLVLYGLMKQIYDLGFMNSVGRFFFDRDGQEDDGGLGRMRVTGLIFLAAWGGFLTFLLWIPADAWSRLLTGGAEQAPLVRIVAVTLYAETLTIVPLTLIRMQGRPALFVTISAARFAATLVLSIVLVAGYDLGVRGALLGNAIPAAGVLLLLLPEYLRARGSRPSRDLLGRMLAFGLPFFPVLLSGWLIEASDRYLLEILRSREEVGWYALGYRVAAVMQISVAAFTMGWAPLRYRIFGRDDAQEIYARLATYFVLAASLLAVALGVFADDVVALIAPPGYTPAAGVLPLLALSYAMGGLYLLMTTGMGVVKKTLPLAGIAGTAAGANIGLNLLLIPTWGIHAAAATTVAANLILIVATWRYSQRVYPIPYDWRRIGRVTALGVAVVILARVVSPPGTGLSLVWASACWLAFVAALVKTRAVAPEEVAALRERVRQRYRSRRPGLGTTREGGGESS